MGGFLDKPNTEKSHEQGGGNGLRYGVASMQGWRVEMEDAHSTITALPGEFKGQQLSTFSHEKSLILSDCLLSLV